MCAAFFLPHKWRTVLGRATSLTQSCERLLQWKVAMTYPNFSHQRFLEMERRHASINVISMQPRLSSSSVLRSQMLLIPIPKAAVKKLEEDTMHHIWKALVWGCKHIFGGWSKEQDVAGSRQRIEQPTLWELMMTTALFPTHAVLHCWFYKQKVTYKYDLGFLAKLHALTCLWRVDPFLQFGLLFQFSWLKQPYWNKNYFNTFLLKVWKFKTERTVGNYTIKVLKLIRTLIESFLNKQKSGNGEGAVLWSSFWHGSG